MRREYEIYDQDKIERDTRVDCVKLFTALPRDFIFKLNDCGQQKGLDETNRKYLTEIYSNRVNPKKQGITKLIAGIAVLFTNISTEGTKRTRAKLEMLSNYEYLSYALIPTRKMWRRYQDRRANGNSRMIENYYIQCNTLIFEVFRSDYVKVDVGKEFFIVVFDVDEKKYAEII